MQKAGQYNSRLTWLVGTYTKDAENGEDVLTHEEAGSLWCNLTEDSGRNGEDYGATVTGANCTIRIRNFPDVTTDDKLADDTYTYTIESIVQGDNELICEAYRNDTLDDTEESSSD